MFVYVYGVLMKHGTAHAWNHISEISQMDAKAKEWFESQYVHSASKDSELVRLLDRNGL
jgi:hypothetical protein